MGMESINLVDVGRWWIDGTVYFVVGGAGLMPLW